MEGTPFQLGLGEAKMDFVGTMVWPQGYGNWLFVMELVLTPFGLNMMIKGYQRGQTSTVAVETLKLTRFVYALSFLDVGKVLFSPNDLIKHSTSNIQFLYQVQYC